MAGLLAVMLLTDVRRPARTDPDGRLIPLAEQDRGRWDAVAIAEGICLITELLTNAPIGHKAARAQYQQAARRTLSVPEQQYLISRAARLSPAEQA